MQFNLAYLKYILGEYLIFLERSLFQKL